MTTIKDAYRLMRARLRSYGALPLLDDPNEEQDKPPGGYLRMTPHFPKGSVRGRSVGTVAEDVYGFLEIEIAVPRGVGIGPALTHASALEGLFAGQSDEEVIYRETETFFDTDQTDDAFYQVPLNVYFEWLRKKPVT